MSSTKYQNPNLTGWDLRWIQQAESIKLWSKDPNRKVGCVLVRDNRRIVEGYNGFPSNILDSTIRLNDSNFKNEVVIHAEKNAILHAAKEGISVKGCSAFITRHPCSQCASVLIEVGIERIVCPSFRNYNGKWSNSFAIASDILYEAGILVHYYEPL